ncbi:Uma2 family endonuclease [Rhodopila sp.]|uniref:Uma2 family endonuclease n=1 Tax=Rhodopila sp. TaxID=2480087 RepID=UPI003D1200EF
MLRLADRGSLELVRGTIVAHAAPTPEHGVILGNLAGELYNRLRGHAESRPEIGSGAAPDYQQRATVRIPDALIRCGQRPRVVFEVVSPSELTHKRQWDQKRADLQAVDGVQEIVEIFQDEVLAHVYRRPLRATLQSRDAALGEVEIYDAEGEIRLTPEFDEGNED